VNQNQALFSLIGTIYGGDGITQFGLPDLRSRVLVGAGIPPSPFTPKQAGSVGGEEAVALTAQTLALHNHNLTVGNPTVSCNATTQKGNTPTPAPNAAPAASYNVTYNANISWYVPSSNNVVQLGGVTAATNPATASTGGSTAHENMQPWLAINYIIALQGLFPPKP
jgi:microcystin-dependent protein